MMQNTRSPITVVIAALNEEEGIGPTLDELHRLLDFSCLIVVDGNSHDKTVEIAKKKGASVLVQDGTGKGDALFKGLQRLGSDVRYVVFTDADFTYPAEFIPKMIEILEQDPNVGMVIGDRFPREISIHRSLKDIFYLGNRLIALAQHMLNGICLNDPLSGLRVVRSDVLRNWVPKSQGFDIEAELNFFVEREGYQIVEMPIDYRYRLGEKKLKLQHGIHILKRIVTESLAD
jgi:glycosyltransferase involved in cell wall biosynthesis